MAGAGIPCIKKKKQAEAEVMPSSNLVEVEVGLIRCKLDEVRCNIFEIQMQPRCHLDELRCNLDERRCNLDAIKMLLRFNLDATQMQIR